MADKSKLTPIASTLGITLATVLTAIPAAHAEQNPFAISEISGYMTAGDHAKEGKCGEGKCGEKGKEEGKCGEGKCGEKGKEEGKCGEGKCGEKGKEEGKCGEGKCGEK